MPKEYVDDAWSFDECVDGDGNPVESPPQFRVKVGWSRERGDVQIATVNENEDIDQFSAEAGLHVNLNRRGINDLIRHLRHARDQAFGRDE